MLPLVLRLGISLLLLSCTVFGAPEQDTFDVKYYSEDGKLNFTEKATKIMLQCEEHTVTTDDGYMLTLFRIPGNTSKTVFLMHGIMDSADAFIMRGNTSLVGLLAKRGYEIWVGNQRGNKYSRKHVNLDPEKDKETYWDFSLQELASYDLRSMIDYILQATEQKRIKAVAHSQANAMFYILGSERPEYNKKVKLLISMAPVAFFHHVKSQAKFLVNTWPIASFLMKLFGQYELHPRFNQEMLKLICTQKKFGYNFCVNTLLFPLVGYDPEELDLALFNIVVNRFPDSSAVNDFGHLAQIGARQKFAKFDYGLLGNLMKYGNFLPPEYDLSKVTMPIILVPAKNDYLSDLEDVELLRKKLPNVVEYHVMEPKKYNHINFLWGKHLAEVLFPLLYNWLENYPINDNNNVL